MDVVKTNLESLILKPEYAPLLALLKSARNGAVYGAKVRFPHALVMVFLFRSGTIRSKLGLILRATRQHARNLATFAFLYKAILLILRQTDPETSGGLVKSSGHKEPSYHTFLAGLLGGYYVFGRGIQSSVNQQIVIYVFARVVLGVAKLAVQPKKDGGWGLAGYQTREQIGRGAWPVFAACSWGGVMWLFRWYPEVLQSSLRGSMTYIYNDSEKWDSLRNFLIHNK